jgi:hypothetical protein
MKKINLSDLKKMIINQEIEIIEEMKDDYLDEEISALKNDMNSVNSTDNLINFLTDRGFTSREAFQLILRLIVDEEK